MAFGVRWNSRTASAEHIDRPSANETHGGPGRWSETVKPLTPLWLLVGAVLLALWRPAETHPETAVFLAVFFLCLIPWTWSRTSADGALHSAVIGVAWIGFLVLSQAGGWNRSEAITQVFLLFGVLGFIWVSSRKPPEAWALTATAFGVAGLAVWGLWQSFGGLDQLRGMEGAFPEYTHAGILDRIDRGRAFASLLLPSHLGVVIATVLPILLARIGRSAKGLVFFAGFLVGVAGVVATRSPVAVALAVAGCGAFLWKRRIGYVWWVMGTGLTATTAVVLVRPDVIRLEPLLLRLDNWSTALWVWATAPACGVGLGGFGQASQSVPWPVGNHPLHAHSLPLELLADLGVFGFALWVAVSVFVIRLARRLWASRPEVSIALMVIPLHNLVDFSFYTSPVAFLWAFLVGSSMALVRPDQPLSNPCSKRWRWIPVLGASVVVSLALLSLTGSAMVEASKGDDPFDDRIARSHRAVKLVPWDAEIADRVGVLALEHGSAEIGALATGVLEASSWQRPRSASRAQLMGRLAELRGEPVSAVMHLWRATSFQPFDERRRVDFQKACERLERRDERP